MPSDVSWKTLYKEELFQLKEEGYDVSSAPELDDSGERFLPIPGCESVIDYSDETVWEEAYKKLTDIYAGKQRSDFGYYEPNSFEEILNSASPVPELETLSDDKYLNRLKGAVYGRIAGIVLGKPLELGLDAASIKDYLVGADAWPLDDYVPATSKSEIKILASCIASTRGNVKFAQPDDDVNYTLLALNLAEKKGLDFSPCDVGKNWIDNVPYKWFWCASHQAYYHMINNVPVEKIPTLLNPWRECIDGQIRSDLWGYIAPADLRKAALGAYKDCSFSLIKNGIYGGMFVAGCISAALSKNPSVDLILDGGLAVIPKQSRLAEAVRNVRDWYSKYKNFDDVYNKIHQYYGHLPFAGTINNLSIVVLAILEGNMDYAKTITTALYGGIDTDCNAGTAGSIIGAAVGFDKIESHWYLPLNDTIKSTVACFGQVSISEVVNRINSVYQKLK